MRTSPDFSQRHTATESSVRSTALAYRFMVRRTVCQRGGAQFRADKALTITGTPTRRAIAPAKKI